MTDAKASAAAYLARGWAPVPVSCESKRPIHEAWPELAAARAFKPEDFEGADGQPRNVGVVLGSVSGGLCDVDLDSQAAIALAPYFLPPTLTFGRKSKPASHYLYKAPGARSAKLWFKCEGMRELVELRATNASSDACGHQTVFPGSTHKSGEAIEFESDAEPAEIGAGDLLWRLSRLAVASAILGTYSEGNHRNAQTLGYAGGLLKSGWTAEEVRELFDAVRECSEDDRPKDADAVERVIAAFENEVEVVGFGSLVKDGVIDAETVAAVERHAKTPEQRARDLATTVAKRALTPRLVAEARETDGMVRVQDIVASAAQEEPTEPEIPAEDLAFLNDVSRTKQGNVANTIANVAVILRWHPEWKSRLGYDEFACRVLAVFEPPTENPPSTPTAGEWTDAHTTRARIWITQRYNFEPGKDATDSAVETVARENTFHPVLQYLDGLTWDSKPRLDAMLVAYFGAKPSDYIKCVSAKFMIGCVARVVVPGCKLDTMLILEGLQGTKKSTAVRVLAGAEWFADTALDFESKDAAQCLQGKWIYEIGELASFNRSEVTRIKAFVSSPSDNLRPSYGRRNVDFPRQCAFVGTTNDSSYLTDTTGNRRYWPVRCGVIDVAGLARDRDQLWAEAAHRYGQGERWWLDGDEEQLAAVEQAERESEDPWEGQIDCWTKKPLKGGEPRERFTMNELLKEALGLEKADQTQANAQRAGRLLAKLGFRSVRARNAADRGRFVTTYTRKAESVVGVVQRKA